MRPILFTSLYKRRGQDQRVKDEEARRQDAQLVIVNLCIGSVGAGERVEKSELYDRRWIEWSAVLASIPRESWADKCAVGGGSRRAVDVLAPEIGFLQLYELCAHMFSSKLASGKVEG
jgi:hypothetical protein